MIIKKFYRHLVLKKAIKSCKKKSRYSVGIFLSNNNEVAKILLDELSEIPTLKYGTIKIISKYYSRFKFSNFSYIDIFYNTQLRPVQRYETVIYDKDLNKKYIKEIIHTLTINKGRYCIMKRIPF